MSIAQLPSEIILQILGYLGSEFFAHDTRKLTISRTWYDLAWRVLVRDLHLTPRSLRRFTENEEAVLRRSSPYITTIELLLDVGIESTSIHSLPTNDSLNASGNVGGIDSCPARLDLSLAKLAAALPRCPKIRSLRIQARGQGSSPSPDHPSYLNTATIAALFSPPHLTSLDLDTAGCRLKPSQNGNIHLCRSINSLLPSLRRLRCRMEDICERLLEHPPGDMVLEEVIINLSISQLCVTITSYRYPNCCQTGVKSFPQLKLALETQAAKLATKLRNPRTVRIISHDLPSLDVLAFDAITGKRVRLENNAEWDADGELVDTEPQEDETDLFDSDSPVTPQIVW